MCMFLRCFAIFGLLACQPTVSAQTPLSTALTYQGQLSDGGIPLNGSADLEFRVFDAPVGGTRLGPIVAATNVQVADGIFTTQLDFGPDVFEGQALWIEIRVRSPHDPTNLAPFDTLTPRQAITAAPAAQTLAPGAVIEGPPGGFLAGVVSVVATEPGIGIATFVDPVSGVGILAAATDLSQSAALVTDKGAVYGTNLQGGFAGYFEQGKSFFGGNVGIGTLTPTVALDVAGDMGVSGQADFHGPVAFAGGLTIDSPISSLELPISVAAAPPPLTPILKIDNTANSMAAIEFSTQLQRWQLGQQRTPNSSFSFFLHDVDADVTRILVPASNNKITFPYNGLQINTTDVVPLRVSRADGTTLFQVQQNGQIFAPLLANIGDQRNMQYNEANGNIGFDTSSRRYKENITPLRTDFSRILLAEPYIYTRKGGDANQWEIGYMAEDLEAIGLTPLVEYNGDGLPDGVNYEKSVLFLNEVIKDQQAQIKSLEARLAEIELLLTSPAQPAER